MKIWSLIEQAVERHGRCALVSVMATEGSVPREAGARMLVTPDGYHGTIGGGTLEWRAIAAAQGMLPHGTATRLTSHALGPDLGQCCGGRVRLSTEIFDRSSLASIRDFAEREAAGSFTVQGRIAGTDSLEHFGEAHRHTYIFGAGHVGKALVLALAPLPFSVHWIDPRHNAFPSMVPANVTLRQLEDVPSVLAAAPAGSLALVMTHSHALDLAVTDAGLRNINIAHVGLIGSSTKRARFERRLREAGIPAARVSSLICPIGVAGIHGKQPAVIAASTVAQLLELNEQLEQAELAGEGLNKSRPAVSGAGTHG